MTRSWLCGDEMNQENEMKRSMGREHLSLEDVVRNVLQAERDAERQRIADELHARFYACLMKNGLVHGRLEK